MVSYLRRVDPSYDPSKDLPAPDEAKPVPAPVPPPVPATGSDINCWLILGAVGATGWAMSKHKKGEL